MDQPIAIYNARGIGGKYNPLCPNALPRWCCRTPSRCSTPSWKVTPWGMQHFRSLVKTVGQDGEIRSDQVVETRE